MHVPVMQPLSVIIRSININTSFIWLPDVRPTCTYPACIMLLSTSRNITYNIRYTPIPDTPAEYTGYMQDIRCNKISTSRRLWITFLYDTIYHLNHLEATYDTQFHMSYVFQIFNAFPSKTDIHFIRYILNKYVYRFPDAE